MSFSAVGVHFCGEQAVARDATQITEIVFDEPPGVDSLEFGALDEHGRGHRLADDRACDVLGAPVSRTAWSAFLAAVVDDTLSGEFG